jgi:hypothetical protein
MKHSGHAKRLLKILELPNGELRYCCPMELFRGEFMHTQAHKVRLKAQTNYCDKICRAFLNETFASDPCLGCPCSFYGPAEARKLTIKALREKGFLP